MLSYIELAKAEGATVECGGERVILEGTVHKVHTYVLIGRFQKEIQS